MEHASSHRKRSIAGLNTSESFGLIRRNYKVAAQTINQTLDQTLMKDLDKTKQSADDTSTLNPEKINKFKSHSQTSC